MAQNMKGYWVIVPGIVLSACMANNALEYDSIAYDNIYHIAKLRKGMNEREVLFIMRQPYSYEAFELDGDVYDVWFYVTQTTVLGQSRMVPRNLSPLTFKNGILVGTGYDYYYYVTRENAKKTQKEIAPKQTGKKPAQGIPPPPAEPSKPSSKPEIENIEFEKALKSPQKPEEKPAQETPVPVKQPAATPAAQRGFKVPSFSKQIEITPSKKTLKTGMGKNVSETVKKETIEAQRPYQQEDDESTVEPYDQGAEEQQEEESEQNFNFW